MNRYLLLRDNKESGPYTVTQLIEKGIKPYDLVWLEGKSAAWRYPSEVDELKTYAPAVEEHPFDRFYKRPEPVHKNVVAEEVHPAPVAAKQPDYSSYAPKVDEPAPSVELPPQKKVYINFPVKPEEPKKVAEQAFWKPAAETVSPRTIPTKKENTDKRFVYASAAVCFVLAGIIAMLLINNRNQQEKLKELNTLVKQIENKQVNASAANATMVKNEQTPPVSTPALPSTGETIINPELLNADDHNAPAPSAKETKTESTPVAQSSTVARHTERKPQNVDGVVFTERTVARRSDKSDTEESPAKDVKAPAPAATDNVFKLVSVTPNNYRTGLLGGISDLQLHLTNNSNRELQKVAIQINYLGPEKKVVHTQTVYFENISAGGQSTIDVPKSKRGVSINYTITDIKS